MSESPLDAARQERSRLLKRLAVVDRFISDYAAFAEGREPRGHATTRGQPERIADAISNVLSDHPMTQTEIVAVLGDEIPSARKKMYVNTILWRNPIGFSATRIGRIRSPRPRTMLHKRQKRKRNQRLPRPS